MTYEEALIKIGQQYSHAVEHSEARFKSLSRVATIVVNRGSFFDMIERGGTCTARSIEPLAAYFRDPANWPGGIVPEQAAEALHSIGRPVSEDTGTEAAA